MSFYKARLKRQETTLQNMTLTWVQYRYLQYNNIIILQIEININLLNMNNI